MKPDNPHNAPAVPSRAFTVHSRDLCRVLHPSDPDRLLVVTVEPGCYGEPSGATFTVCGSPARGWLRIGFYSYPQLDRITRWDIRDAQWFNPETCRYESLRRDRVFLKIACEILRKGGGS
ncbi:MAG: hypothetical protein P5680_23270 [Limnospira sp. PMC 737.11]|uniref:hypothetical protein n=1 Tax=unclassified Limnospira TaxID=2642885 RepID=UPI0028E0C5CE|nr:MULTISPECIES: hypothetical protein [unclassified Limnospira]MDT9267278.1 hypothetical protein [Limnospira sp. PMC 1223.20]MDT9277465.1 hypothetical protein [Limnospira sp. PMC 737.11]